MNVKKERDLRTICSIRAWCRWIISALASTLPHQESPTTYPSLEQAITRICLETEPRRKVNLRFALDQFRIVSTDARYM